MKKVSVILFTILMLVILTVPAMAEVKIGGIIFTDFYYLSRDKDNAKDWGLGNGISPYNVTAIQVPNITRLNARWTNEDNVGMFIELGVGQTGGNIQRSQSDGVELRHAYGWWDVNSNLRLTAGKTTTPFSPLHPSQLIGTRSKSWNIVGAGFGDIYPSRIPQIRGTYKFNNDVRVALALVDPNGIAEVVGNKGPWKQKGVSSSKIPRIDIGVPITLSWMKLYPSFMWQRKTIEILEEPDNPEYPTNYAVTTYIASLGLKTGFGPVSFSAEGQWGKNWGNAGGFMGYTYPAIFSSVGYKDRRVSDADVYSFWLDLAYKVGIVTPHLMYGEMKTENKYGGTDLDSKSKMMGVSCPIDVAKGLRVRPEFMVYDEGTIHNRGEINGDYEAGKYFIVGAQFQITF